MRRETFAETVSLVRVSAWSADNSRKRKKVEGKRKNGATGRSDIEGKTARVTASDTGRERVSIKSRGRGDVRLATASPSVGGHGEWS